LAQGGVWYLTEKFVYICKAVLLWKCVLKAPPSAKLPGVGGHSNEERDDNNGETENRIE
jgi:hypothetical protein